MDRPAAGLLLKDLLGRHRSAEATALGGVAEDAYEEQMAAIEAASTLEVEGMRLEVRRRRSIDWCPFAECRFARLRKACEFSNVRFTLSDPRTGMSVSGAGLLWHLMAEHPAREENVEDERALLEVLGIKGV